MGAVLRPGSPWRRGRATRRGAAALGKDGSGAWRRERHQEVTAAPDREGRGGGRAPGTAAIPGARVEAGGLPAGPAVRDERPLGGCGP